VQNITRHSQDFEPVQPIQLALHLDQMSRPLSYVSEVHERYVPYCANAILRTTQRIQRLVVFLRASGSLQSLASRESLKPGNFMDTGENRLIQGILGSPSEIPLVEINIENDQISARFLVAWSLIPQEVSIF